MTFAMALARYPPAYQGKPNHKFQDALRSAAGKVWHSRPLLEGDLYARILWFYTGQKEGDIDNKLKNILDALQGTVYVDDSSIVQVTAYSIDRGRDYTVSDATLPSDSPEDVFDRLSLLLEANPKDILYIEVGQAIQGRAVFGPVDGGVE
jgi:hypothetical protein